jgi:hypothetical protein
MSIARNGNNVIISWSYGPSFSLQATGSLSGKPVWTTMGTQNPQTVAMTAQTQFFRLAQ